MNSYDDASTSMSAQQRKLLSYCLYYGFNSTQKAAPSNQKDADGNRIKYYSKGDLVTTLTTGKDGKATAKNLPLGQYRVVEVEAPYGYVLNPNEQKVTFTYVDDKTPVIKESLTFSDDRQKLDMSVTKLDSEDNTPIVGAVFGLYADEDIKNVDGNQLCD